jgi:hypothetical protein
MCWRGIRIGELVYKLVDSNKSQNSDDAEYITKFLENLSMTETSRNKHKRDMCVAGLATFPNTTSHNYSPSTQSAQFIGNPVSIFVQSMARPMRVWRDIQ